MLNLLFGHAQQVRAALEAVPGLDDIGIGQFPYCCDYASLVLGRYVLEHTGYGLFSILSGWKGQKSHSWLQQGRLVVDITADQFGLEPVYIQEDSEFHKKLRRDPGLFLVRTEEDYAYRFETVMNADWLYVQVMEQLKKKAQP